MCIRASKNIFLYLKSMNLSLGINFNLIIPFRPTKDTHGKSIQGWMLLICLAIAKPKV